MSLPPESIEAIDLVNKMPNWKQTVFALAITERLLPAYNIFIDEAARTNVELLHDGVPLSKEWVRSKLDSVWHILESDGPTDECIQLSEECRDYMPSNDDHPYVKFRWAAAEVLMALCILFDSLLEPVDASEIVARAREAIAQFQYVEVASAEEFNHFPLMVKEALTEQLDAKFLASIPDNKPDSFANAKQRWFRSTKSCLVLDS